MRLKDNFFDTNEIVVLESLPDGYLYSNILLKLYLRSLKNNGKLMFTDRIPYNAQMIATITRHQVGTVEKALQLFKDMGLIEILDTGAIYMADIQQYIGRSSTEAERKKIYRQRINDEKKMLEDKCHDKCLDISTPEIEIEKEIEIERDIDISSSDDQTAVKTRKTKHKYGEYKHVLLTDDELDKLYRDYGEYQTQEAIKYLDEAIEMKGYKYKSHYLAMRKWVFDAVKKHTPKNNNMFGDDLAF